MLRHPSQAKPEKIDYLTQLITEKPAEDVGTLGKILSIDSLGLVSKIQIRAKCSISTSRMLFSQLKLPLYASCCLAPHLHILLSLHLVPLFMYFILDFPLYFPPTSPSRPLSWLLFCKSSLLCLSFMSPLSLRLFSLRPYFLNSPSSCSSPLICFFVFRSEGLTASRGFKTGHSYCSFFVESTGSSLGFHPQRISY